MFNWVFGFVFVVVIFVFDQLIKWIVIVLLNFKIVGQIEILLIFNLIWVENYGVLFGLFIVNSELGCWLLMGLIVFIVSVVVVWLWCERNWQDVLGLGFILGGVFGNIFDWVWFGYVVDFVDLYFGVFCLFLVFNIVDVVIIIGVFIFLVCVLFVWDKLKVD